MGSPAVPSDVSPAPPLVFGRRADLPARIETHLFIISPNNSGSTFLKNALARSAHTWNLHREGQHTPGFRGPSTIAERLPNIWAARPEWLARFQDPAAYDWATSQRAWYFQAYAARATASVFVEKSPPFLTQVAALAAHFKNARFVFLVRNPYPVIESIARRYRGAPSARHPQLAAPVTEAARHVVACLTLQRDNLARFGARGLFLTYERMCAEPAAVAADLRALVPVLDDLDLDQRIPVKGLYDERLRDMNAQQVARLSADDLREAHAVLAPHAALLASFGYGVLPD